MRLAMNMAIHPTRTPIAINVICLFISIFTVVNFLFEGLYLINRSEREQHRKNDSDSVVTFNLDSFYTPRDVVNCLDNLLKTQKRKVQIVFIGDSLIRNHFLSFIQLIPDYDRAYSAVLPWTVRNFQEDIDITYHGVFQDFKVSFIWRPFIYKDFLSEFERWNAFDHHQVPYLIFLGVGVHHMNKNLSRPFEQLLEQELLPLLNDYLTIHPLGRLIWLIQPPTLDRRVSIPEELGHHSEIHFDHIVHYNKMILRALQGTRILVTDFSSFVKEFHRACAVTGYQREEPTKFVYCGENLHPPFLVMLQFTRHILFKHVCTVEDEKV